MTDLNASTTSRTAVSEKAETALFTLSAVTKRYGSASYEVFALREVDLRIREGEYVVIVGPSGSGKSTLLQMMAALDRPTSGSIELNGRDLASLDDRELARIRREDIGIIFQQFNLIPTLTAQDNVEAALAPSGLGTEERHERARALLNQVGLGHRVSHLPSQLSGGEQQRVAIARALANSPRVLLADEPTGNLDSTTGSEILALLADLSTVDGQTIVLITHDDEIAANSQRLVRMRDGQIQTSDLGADDSLVP
jgi:putative ABC transport system ATP-binding protein